MTVLSQTSFAAVVPQEITCLATNIYWEARNQSVEGMIAVGAVTRNRVHNPHFPNNYCDVVYQAKLSKWWFEHHQKEVPLRNKCQFSWYCDGKSDDIPFQDKELYERIKRLAVRIYFGYEKDNTFGSNFYHADYVYPLWADTMTHTVTIDNHIFYRSD